MLRVYKQYLSKMIYVLPTPYIYTKHTRHTEEITKNRTCVQLPVEIFIELNIFRKTLVYF